MFQSTRLAEKRAWILKDITTIMDNGKAYGYATDQIVEFARERSGYYCGT